MNKTGSTYFLVLMLAIIFFFLGLALAPALNETVSEARSNADCSNSSLDSFQKGNCLQMDLYMPYFIGVIFALVGTLIGGVIAFNY